MSLLNLGLPLWLILNLAKGAQYPPLHPKFQVPPASYPGIQVFTEYDSGAGIWHPTVPTFLFQRSSQLSEFILVSTIQDVFNDVPKFSVKYECSENDAAYFNITHKAELCSYERRVAFRVASVERVSASSVKFSLTIEPSEKYDKERPERYQKFNFILDGDGWSLTSNSIYLYKWNFLLDLKRRNVMPRFNTLDSLMKEAWYPGSQPAFNSVQFFTARGMSFISKAPTFYKSFISAAVIFQFNVGVFQSDFDHLIIGTDNDPSRWNEHDAKLSIVARANFKSHRVYYSSMGLNNVAFRLVSLSRPPPDSCKLSVPNCTPHIYCPVIFNALISESPSCSREHNLFSFSTLAKLDLVGNGSKATCKVMDDYEKNIVIFAGFPNIVTCPIICSNVEEVFGFYKGKTPLLPSNGVAKKWFTRHGALKILQSGFAIQFEAFANNEDSGEYMCIAGGEQAHFRISIVSLPSFHVPNSTRVDGRLPNRIYVFPGDKYSVKCTAYYSGLKSVTINPQFYVEEKANHFRQVDKPGLIQIWKSQSVPFHLNIDISVANSADSTTLTLSVDRVPLPSKQSQQFNHRFLCRAELGKQDLKDYFGLPEYTIETGSDVVVLPQPKLDDFLANHAKCCQKECVKERCKMEVTLKPGVRSYLRSLGIKIHAQFSAPIVLQQKSLRDWIRAHSKFDPVNSRLTWEMKKGLGQLKDENKAILFPNLIAIFTYTNPLANGAASRPMIDRRLNMPPAVMMKAANDCLSDPSCVYTTAFNQTVSEALTVARQLVIEKRKIVDLKDELSEENSGDSEQKLTDLQKRYMELMRQSRRRKTGCQMCSNTGLVMLTVHIILIIYGRWIISSLISLLPAI